MPSDDAQLAVFPSRVPTATIPFGPAAIRSGDPLEPPLVPDFHVFPSDDRRNVPLPGSPNPAATNCVPVQTTSSNCEPATEFGLATVCHGPDEIGSVGGGVGGALSAGLSVGDWLDACVCIGVASTPVLDPGVALGALVQAAMAAAAASARPARAARLARTMVPLRRLPSARVETTGLAHCCGSAPLSA